MSNNYNNKKIYQNKLIVTKDINKKNQIKQEIINKNQNDSFLIFDENGSIYNKEKENLLKNGYTIKTLNFIKGKKVITMIHFFIYSILNVLIDIYLGGFRIKKIYLMEQLHIFFNFCQNFQMMKINL